MFNGSCGPKLFALILFSIFDWVTQLVGFDLGLENATESSDSCVCSCVMQRRRCSLFRRLKIIEDRCIS